MKKAFQTIVANATVTISRMGGRGVLMRGGMIVTAAHCIDFHTDGGMALANYGFIKDIETARGEKFKVQVWAVESVADIAVFGALDDQLFPRDMQTPFERFCHETTPLTLWRNEFSIGATFSAHIYIHKGTWIDGQASEWVPSIPGIDAREAVEGGTSGSPIIYAGNRVWCYRILS